MLAKAEPEVHAMPELDPLLLSRIQFAFTVSFHILFPSFTIGLAAWLLVLEIVWLRTGKAIYAELVRHWTKIFAVSFGMGVVSGVVLSYEFGTNWSEFSRRGGNVIGPLMSYEVLTAFFLEAGFLGIMLFGQQRVPKAVHLFATAMVALGTVISAFWILSANSWMQTPVGFTVDAEGVLHVADWWQVIFNPSFPYRFTHMLAAAYLTTAFAVGGVGAWYILRGENVPHGRIMLGMALSLIVWLAPLQLFIGDLHGLNTREHQPAKIAAVEAHWETQKGAPLILFAWPDVEAETNHYEVAIPRLGSLVLTHEWEGEVQGLKAFPRRRPAEPDHPLLRLPRHGRHRHDHDRAWGHRRRAVAQGTPLFEPLVPEVDGLGFAARLRRRACRLVRGRGGAPALHRLRRPAHGRLRFAGDRRQGAHLAHSLRACLWRRVRRRRLLHRAAHCPRAGSNAAGAAGRGSRPIASAHGSGGEPMTPGTEMTEFLPVILPLVWGAILAFAVFLYVLLGGYDLGLGVLFPLAPSHEDRDAMMGSVSPFWDGNETWLVLGGGGLLAAFPLAYSVMLPALYLPIILMLIGLDPARRRL